MLDGTHGAAFHGLWHIRQVRAWKHAWKQRLIDQVVWHGDNLYTVPSQTTPDKWYAVWRYTMEPDGYLYLCDCAASSLGGVVCAHSMAVYLWRLREHMGWRLLPPKERE